MIELAEHDRLLLTTDGVHGALSERHMARFSARNSAEATASELVDAALAAGSQDNATALVIDIVRLPAPDHDGILAGLSALPAIEPPRAGDSFDGFRHRTRAAAKAAMPCLLAAVDGEDRQQVVLKFPRRSTLSERAIRLAFAREMLLGPAGRQPVRRSPPTRSARTADARSTVCNRCSRARPWRSGWRAACRR